jgi:hypothetical protein
MAFLFEQIVAMMSERHRVKTLTELAQVEPGETQEELAITEEELSDHSNIEEPPSNVTEVTDVEVIVEVIVESMDIITMATQENE